MNPIVKKDILNVLREASEIVLRGEYFKLRELSDHVIHNASIFQDKDSITIAVTVYALSKINNLKKIADRVVIPHLTRAVKSLEEGNLNNYESEIKHILKGLSEKDDKTRYYLQEVLERAEIKKASRMFEHGISMGQVADALGISIWDVMDYVGKTRIVDQFEYKPNVSGNLKFARAIFNVAQK